VDFMLIERSEHDVFTEAWKQTRTGTTGPQNVLEDVAPMPVAGGVDETPEKPGRKRGATGEVQQLSSNGGASSKGGGSGGPPEQKPSKPSPGNKEATSLKKEVTKALGELTKTKAKFASASSSTRTLLERISTVDGWKWANTDFLTKKLKTLKAEEATLMTDEFNNEVMTSEVAELKKTYKDEGGLLQAAKKFNQEVGLLAVNMEREVKILMHMHRLQVSDSS
jgi:hypothetical protein